jgi:hypothetical protein
MKTEKALHIPFKDFAAYNNIEWRDGVDATWHEYQQYSAADIADCTEHDYTREQLEQCPTLLGALVRAYNRAEADAWVAEYDNQQDKALEAYCEALADRISDIHATLYDTSIDVSITVAEYPDCAGYGGSIAVSGDWKGMAAVIASTLEGEGMFACDSALELLRMGPFTSYKKAVQAHLHYLLNGSLMRDIWGTGPVFAIQDDRLWCPDSSDFIDDAIAEETYDERDTIRLELQAYKYAKNEPVVA